MEPVISVKNISKEYKIYRRSGRYIALRDILAEKLSLKTLLGFKKTTKERFHALNNVSFDVYKGEVLGVIGSNGAGKSTLLKILSKITPPTSGEIQMSGTVSSLLEVGTGFHPELTGRENVYLNGAILGMKRAEINKKFDQIVEFSGITSFLDTPVKRYSSGMQVRLAFAVAAHLQSEILIVDEVLAVGDAAFQKKSLGKMEEVTKQEGRTILFVSHNMEAVSRLCDRCILLEQGKIVMIGKTEDVIARYLDTQQTICAQKKFESRDDADVNLLAVTIENSKKKIENHIGVGEPFTVSIEYELKKELTNFYVGLGFIQTKFNLMLLNALDVDANKHLYTKREAGKYRSVFIFENNPFNLGNHKLFIHLGTFPKTPKTFCKSENDLSIIFEEGESFISDTIDGKRNSLILENISSRIEKLN